ncbi:beta subunit of citrate lyase [Peniophora sp. CONT]|nr:beta subunit of citrate lyase [Peniophora sp. CONT]
MLRAVTPRSLSRLRSHKLPTPLSGSRLHEVASVRPYSVSQPQLDGNVAQLRRSYLYVPCSSDRMLQKSVSTGADTVIYDLEDSVAPSEKDKAAARGKLAEFLASSRDAPDASRIAVRLNDVTTPFFERDLEQALRLSHMPGTLVLPKVHSIDYLDKVASIVDSVAGSMDTPIRLVASIESARSLYNIGSIAGWRHSSGKTRVAGLLFAAEDYCADTGIIRTAERTELLYTRSQVVLTAKAFGLEAIDMVCVNYKDPEYLKEECEDGRRLGFTGKQAIHPIQVETIHKTFAPSKKEVYRAAKIVHQMAQAHASEKGAIGLDLGDGKDGKEMVDAPMLKQAQNTLKIARAAGLPIPEF